MAVLRGVAVEEDEEDEEDEESESEDEAEEAQMVQIPMLLKTIAEENEANECWCGVAFWVINAAFYILVRYEIDQIHLVVHEAGTRPCLHRQQSTQQQSGVAVNSSSSITEQHARKTHAQKTTKRLHTACDRSFPAASPPTHSLKPFAQIIKWPGLIFPPCAFAGARQPVPDQGQLRGLAGAEGERGLYGHGRRPGHGWGHRL